MCLIKNCLKVGCGEAHKDHSTLHHKVLAFTVETLAKKTFYFEFKEFQLIEFFELERANTKEKSFF